MAKQPLWRQTFDTLERPVGRALENLVESDRFADVFATTWKVAGRVRGEFERNSHRALRLWNLPAANDVDALSRQLAAVERQVRELRSELHSVGDERNGDGRRNGRDGSGPVDRASSASEGL